MKTLLIALAGMLVGVALGGFLALGFGSGVGAAGGLIYGSQVGHLRRRRDRPRSGCRHRPGGPRPN